MVIKHDDYLKENISNLCFALDNNLHASNISMKHNYVANSGISSVEHNLRTPPEYISPYLNGPKLQILSQISQQKKVLQKRSVASSFSQACKIYKANSDEFKCNKRKNKKDKISSNKIPEPTTPQAVSDMNDSEYLKRVDNNRRYKQKKRRVTKDVYRSNETKTYEFYNGDLLRSPGVKADLDNLNKTKAKNCKMLKTKKKRKGIEDIQSGDVWSMLRDMNTFQYISSPPISVGSVETIKKRGKFRKNEKEAGFIETCTTEEFSYISSYDITGNSHTRLSQQSSYDRITIIDRNGDFKAMKSIDLNSGTLKKKVYKTKQHIKNRQNERQNLIKPSNRFEICNNKNEIDNNICADFKKCLSKKTLNGSPNRYDSQATVLNDCDRSMENLTSKDKFITITPKKQSTFAQCNSILEVIKCHQSNDKLLKASEKTSKVGLSLNNTKCFNEYNNQGKDILTNIREPCKNPRVPVITPKLTKTEIRRRLANLKFPIVILGKDEISSKFQVVHYDFDQFNGLGQQIWFYMTEWLDDLKCRNKHRLYINNNNNLNTAKSKNILNVPTTNGKNVCNILDQDAESRNETDGKKNSKLIIDTKVGASENKSQKPKVLNQFKNRMLGFISSKNQKYSADNNNVIKDNPNEVSINQKDTSPEGDTKERNKNFDTIKNHTGSKYPWSKVKWASDFIDNILRKMKKGIYYTHSSEEVKSKLDSEFAIPVVTDQAIEDVGEETPEETTENAIIPGFDDTQATMAPIVVEVKMITRTQISVYHCSTNVVLQFDITIPSKIEKMSSLSLSSFAPVINEDKNIFYKCKTSLANGALPAQLCSIIPKLLSKILKTSKKDTHVPTISYDTTLKLPHGLEILKDGNFSVNTPMKEASKKLKNILNWDSNYYYNNMNLLPTIQIKSSWVPLLQHISVIIPKSYKIQSTNELILKKPVQNYCMALVPYVPPPFKANISQFSNSKFKLHNDLQKCLLGYKNFMGGVNFWREISNCENYNNINNTDKLREASNFVSDIPLNISVLPFEAIPCNKTTKTIETKRVKNEKSGYQFVRKNIRKTFKSRTKCKSMTNMVKEYCSTPLNKIINLDDFLQALGCCKQLTAVFHGYSEKKILSSINEMKCWIKEISPTQALLVLLLSNKKETKDLKRFRPMLLQGIAVKRITTASELDMEIEVIEKENICISQNEGISLLSVSNGYNLLEELCWIAKTTASDYQKPYDDSSKKLLKSLLEKRKKLNPSYLRVMARYVGLGLLKPRKNCL